MKAWMLIKHSVAPLSRGMTKQIGERSIAGSATAL
jgi:hypothetical protein